MIKIFAMCLIVAATAGTCQNCGKQLDKAISQAKTAIATYVPTQAPDRNSSYLAMGDSVPAGEDRSCPVKWCKSVTSSSL